MEDPPQAQAENGETAEVGGEREREKNPDDGLALALAVAEEEDVAVGPAPPPQRRPKRPLQFEQAYLDTLPSANMYEKSFMHRDVITHVAVSGADFFITGSCDGHLKFWKKKPIGIEFAKHFRSHLGPIEGLSVSNDGLLSCTISNDQSVKVYDVVNFDMMVMLRLPYVPGAVEWVYKQGDIKAKLAVSDRNSSFVHVYDVRAGSNQPVISKEIHMGPVKVMKYNPVFDAVISADARGIIEYWNPSTLEFPESGFYASEVVAALEYIHMMGIVYRDLKPENVLVRSDGHIMLTDFDLSLKCNDHSTPTPQIITSSSNQNPSLIASGTDPTSTSSSSCILPNCIVPTMSCFSPNRKNKWINPKNKKSKNLGRRFEPEFVAEPVDIRSMSFVGTHEYLAPEIVCGEGHGSAVDWWTSGVFIFELFYGTTPFKGVDNDMTLANIVARALEFPKEPSVPNSAKDLITQLLIKDPTQRLGSVMGATPIKQHPFFNGVNWALLRCVKPPFVPPPFSCSNRSSRENVSDESCPNTPIEYY